MLRNAGSNWAWPALLREGSAQQGQATTDWAAAGLNAAARCATNSSRVSQLAQLRGEAGSGRRRATRARANNAAGRRRRASQAQGRCSSPQVVAACRSERHGAAGRRRGPRPPRKLAGARLRRKTCGKAAPERRVRVGPASARHARRRHWRRAPARQPAPAARRPGGTPLAGKTAASTT